MKKILLPFVILYLLGVRGFGPAFAQDKKIFVTPTTTHFTAQSCIDAGTNRTATIEVGNVGPSGSALTLAVIEAQLTYNASATVTMTCTASDNGGTTAYKIQECPVSSGVATCVDQSWSRASGGASGNWVNRIDTTGFVRISCVFLCSGAGTDTLTVKSYQTTK
jgi:hypothetical protein